MENELLKRKPLRYKNFDYNQIGVYFITLCTNQKQQILSSVGADVLDGPKNDVLDGPKNIEIFLSSYGKIADKYINQLNDFYDNINVVSYVIMPNHIHILLIVSDETNGPSRTSAPTRQHSTVSRFVSTFKRFCNKEYGENIWQRGFYDHIIRNREDYDEHMKYIYENPMRWYYKQFENIDD